MSIPHDDEGMCLFAKWKKGISMDEFSTKSWTKHISGMHKEQSGQSQSFKLGNKYKKSAPVYEPNLYYLYEDKTYCVMPGGHAYMMQPLQVPSIGYRLVESDIAMQTIIERSVSITEYQALNVMFYSHLEDS